MELNITGITGSYNPTACRVYTAQWKIVSKCKSDHVILLFKIFLCLSFTLRTRIQICQHAWSGPGPTSLAPPATIPCPSFCLSHTGILVSLVRKTCPSSGPLHLLFYPSGTCSAPIAMYLTLDLFIFLFKEAFLATPSVILHSFILVFLITLIFLLFIFCLYSNRNEWMFSI